MPRSMQAARFLSGSEPLSSSPSLDRAGKAPASEPPAPVGTDPIQTRKLLGQINTIISSYGVPTLLAGQQLCGHQLGEEAPSADI